MTVPDFFPNARVLVTEPMRFVPTVSTVEQGQAVSVTLDPVSFRGLADAKRRAVRLGFHLTYEPLPQESRWVPGCPWCGVRPEEREWDCDGLFGTGSCGSPQCNQLKRCQGCGVDGIASVNGMCRPCYDLARYGSTDQAAALSRPAE
ncbi:hypothetical protein ACFVGM_09140 [Kitasatospora purpeofusca]|uniref:hypothetical protein n=1 Tax=Kitasatospora purpeofusca TaxID=67352 RepID=UPI003684C0C9